MIQQCIVSKLLKSYSDYFKEHEFYEAEANFLV
jgi:hypothetical protein